MTKKVFPSAQPVWGYVNRTIQILHRRTQKYKIYIPSPNMDKALGLDTENKYDKPYKKNLLK